LWQKRLYRYNIQGWQMEETIANFARDGQPQGSSTNRWTYDAYGNAIDNPRPYAEMGIWMAYREFTYYQE